MLLENFNFSRYYLVKTNFILILVVYKNDQILFNLTLLLIARSFLSNVTTYF